MKENQEEIRVATIEPAPGATVAKIKPGTRMNPYSKFTFDVVYILEDGRRLTTQSDHKLKRDAVAELASLPKPPKWETTVTLEDGHLQWTTMKLGISSLIGAGD